LPTIDNDQAVDRSKFNHGEYQMYQKKRRATLINICDKYKWTLTGIITGSLGALYLKVSPFVYPERFVFIFLPLFLIDFLRFLGYRALVPLFYNGLARSPRWQGVARLSRLNLLIIARDFLNLQIARRVYRHVVTK
jgi:hypothetical protein